MIKAIIFDLDGTLVDTEKAAVSAIDQTFQEWGISLSPEVARSVAGRKWEIAFSKLKPFFPKNVSDEEVAQKILDQYQKNLVKGPPEVSGAREIVHLFSQFFRIALVTGSTKRQALFALNHLDVLDVFEHVLAAEDYVESKPSPEGYLKALSLMDLEPHEAVVFEDSEAGIQSAKNAGIKVFAIRATNHFSHSQEHADGSIHDWLEVDEAWIKKNLTTS
ncbi:MAG: HAD family phosphatase [Oligoflexia bacterium]|nr:HAD family phosphatase [Oligoflexia bacterium]